MRIQVSFCLLFVPIFSIFFTLHVSGQCLDNQRSLLLALKNEFTYDSSWVFSGWNQTVEDCCSWDGVICDEAGHVVGLDLYNQTFNGAINDSSSLFGLTYLELLNLADNSFLGPLPSGFGKLTHLRNLDLTSSRFEGEIPDFIFNLPNISTLKLSGNKFSGNIELEMFGKFKELYVLELSFNNLTVGVNANKLSFTELNTLKLASCNIKQFPDLKNESSLMMLDLSDNELSGEIPNWIWDVGNGYLRFLNLSHNMLSGLQKPYTFPFLLDVLDLHSNNLKGDIPVPPRRVYVLDYSNNNFGSSIPVDFGNVLRSTLFFSISNSQLVGVIPESICNASSLSVLDLSNNSLSGTIPSCLAEMINKTLRVLHLGRNNLTGNVIDVFPESCNLQSLDLSGNHLQGPFPPSLMNCKNLEVLNLGDNMIKDVFPCWLSNLSSLHVFVIRSNSFYGNITCLESNSNWPNLQIIDIASNGFSGVLPPKLFAGFYAIMDKFDNQSMLSHLHFVHPGTSAVYYQDSTSVVLKGQTTELVKILNIFTSIDFSNNSFQGSIPVTVGDLKLLRLLNLSHNALTGPVPLSLGKLEKLESLDFSVNKLSGNIPTQLAQISFLSLLNLSYNQLSGSIPRGSQFQTFTEDSFKGNKGLCGIPLNKSCGNTVSEIPTISINDDEYSGTGLYVSVGLGFVVGFMIIVGPLIYLRRCRTWFDNYVDTLLSRINKTKDKQSVVISRSLHQKSTFY